MLSEDEMSVISAPPLFGLLHRAGLTVMIHTEKTVMARLEEEAQFRCQLLTPTDVFKVTWRKILPDGEKRIIASQDKYFGQRVEPEFSSRVEFRDTGLQNSSLVIKQVRQEDVGCYSCSFIAYPEGAFTATACLELYGLNSQIETPPTVTAALGGKAHLHCQLIETKDIRQVTWQKILTSGVRTVVTIHKSFPHKVGLEYINRTECEGAGLQNSSIVIRELKEDDEGCYYCLFNTYPDGAFTAKTCLQVHQLHGPFLGVEESNSSEEAVVSCSATGRPTPTVMITIPQLDLHVLHNSSVCVFNNNNTFTVTETAVLSRPHANSTEVGCKVEVHSGPQRTVSMMLSGIKQPSDEEGFQEDLGPPVNGRSRAFLFVLSVFVTCCVLGVIFLLFKKTSHQNILMVTPPAPAMDPHTTEASLQGSRRIRQRSSPKKNEKEDTSQ